MALFHHLSVPNIKTSTLAQESTFLPQQVLLTGNKTLS